MFPPEQEYDYQAGGLEGKQKTPITGNNSIVASGRIESRPRFCAETAPATAIRRIVRAIFGCMRFAFQTKRALKARKECGRGLCAPIFASNAPRDQQARAMLVAPSFAAPRRL